MRTDDWLLAIAHDDQRLAMALRAVFEHLRDAEDADLRDAAQWLLDGNPDLELDEELAGAYAKAIAIVTSGGVNEFVSGRDPDQMRQFMEVVLSAKHLLTNSRPGDEPTRSIPASAAGQWLHALTVRDVARRNAIREQTSPDGTTTRGEAMMFEAAFELAVKRLYISGPQAPEASTLADLIVEIEPAGFLDLANTEA
jgi:hypothetical protein